MTRTAGTELGNNKWYISMQVLFLKQILTITNGHIVLTIRSIQFPFDQFANYV